MIVILLKLLLFAASTLGFFLFLSSRTGLAGGFIPAVTISGEILFLFLCALIGLLLPGAYILLAAGVGLLVFQLLRDRRSFAFLLSPQLVMFLLISLVGCGFAALYRFPPEWDNYTHWARIVREMYETNALPVEGTFVDFMNYPPATALYLWFVLKCSAFSEQLMLAAQNVICAAFLTVLTTDCKWRELRRLLRAAILTVACACAIEQYNNFMSLQVDALLGYISAASAIALCRYREEGDKWRCDILVALFGAVLALSKESGAFLLVLVYFFGLFVRQRRGGNRALAYFIPVCAAVAVPMLFRFLFNLRTDLVFPVQEAGKTYNVEVSGALSGLAGKSAEFKAAFPKLFLKTFFNKDTVSTRYLWLLTLGTAAWFLYCRIRRRPVPQVQRRTLLGAWALTAVYFVGVFATYFFMMSEAEGNVLASYNRYMGTGVIFLLGGVFSCSLVRRDQEGECPPETLLVRFCAAPLLLAAALSLYIPRWIWANFDARDQVFRDIDDQSPYIQAALDDYDGPLYLIEQKAGYYPTVFARYRFATNDILQFPVGNTAGMTAPYILVYLSGDEAQNEAFTAVTGAAAERGVYYVDAEGRYCLLCPLSEGKEI